MATIAELCERGVVRRLHVRLPLRHFEDREFYGYPQFLEWLDGPVRRATPFDASSIKPALQAHALFLQFISGKPMSVGRQFKRMRPHERDVFELRTDDLRIFGWFPAKNIFIAVVGDFMENTHGHDLYPGYRDLVVRERELIDLDEPKWQPGASEYDVISF